MDAFACRSERDFANAFVTAVINWVAFICDRLEKTEKSISEELAGAICDIIQVRHLC